MQLSALYRSAKELVSRLESKLALRILLLFVKKDDWAPYPPRDESRALRQTSSR